MISRSSLVRCTRTALLKQSTGITSSCKLFHTRSTVFRSTEQNQDTQEQKQTQDQDNGASKKIAELTEQINTLQKSSAEFKDRYIRAIAEVENIRKIAHRDVDDAKKYGVADFAKSLLDVNDNLKRAIDNTDPEIGDAKEQLHTLLEGIKMTRLDLIKAFEKVGIAEYDPIGQPFDPSQQNALFRIAWTEGAEPNTVGQVINTGYTIKTRILRPAKVGVIGPKPQIPEKLEADFDHPSHKKE